MNKLAAARKALARAEAAVGLRASSISAEFSEADSLATPDFLRPVFPHGIVRGGVISVSGQFSGALLLAGFLSAQGSWVAIAGVRNIGWDFLCYGARELHRIVYFPDLYGFDQDILPILIDGFDVVVGNFQFSLKREKVLAQRARNRGSLLISANWSGGALELDTQFLGASGFCQGKGYLRECTYEFRTKYGKTQGNLDGFGWKVKELQNLSGGLRVIKGGQA